MIIGPAAIYCWLFIERLQIDSKSLVFESNRRTAIFDSISPSFLVNFYSKIAIYDLGITIQIDFYFIFLDNRFCDSIQVDFKQVWLQMKQYYLDYKFYFVSLGKILTAALKKMGFLLVIENFARNESFKDLNWRR